MSIRNHLVHASVAFGIAVGLPAAVAQKKYDPGASDTEIKIGQTMPYSGPASAYGALGKAEAAYFKKINDEGGINGRKIVFISLDDGYSPPKTVEATRRLVEQDEVLLMFGSLGTATNTAVHGYLNAARCHSSSSRAAPANGTIRRTIRGRWASRSNYQTEARIYAKHILQTRPERQDRRAVPERRLRQGLPEGPEGRARRQGREDDRG